MDQEPSASEAKTKKKALKGDKVSDEDSIITGGMASSSSGLKSPPKNRKMMPAMRKDPHPEKSIATSDVDTEEAESSSPRKFLSAKAPISDERGAATEELIHTMVKSNLEEATASENEGAAVPSKSTMVVWALLCR